MQEFYTQLGLRYAWILSTIRSQVRGEFYAKEQVGLPPKYLTQYGSISLDSTRLI